MSRNELRGGGGRLLVARNSTGETPGHAPHAPFFWLAEKRGKRMHKTILNDETGQDLVEYTLLLAFICLTGAAFYFGVGQSVNGIWSTVNSRLADAASAGSSS